MSSFIFSDSDVPNTNTSQADEEVNEVACLEVPQNIVDWIEKGLTANGEAKLVNAQAVKSNNFEKVYFVSAEFTGPGFNNEVGTWSTNNIEDEALVLSVNAMAKEFTDWFHGDREGAQFHVTMAYDGGYESQECLK